MTTLETITIDVYPWAAPTAEQRAMFDALPAAERRKMVLEAIEDGFASGLSDKSVGDIIAAGLRDVRDAS
jgi:hypothetical protein